MGGHGEYMARGLRGTWRLARMHPRLDFVFSHGDSSSSELISAVLLLVI